MREKRTLWEHISRLFRQRKMEYIYFCERIRWSVLYPRAWELLFCCTRGHDCIFRRQCNNEPRQGIRKVEHVKVGAFKSSV